MCHRNPCRHVENGSAIASTLDTPSTTTLRSSKAKVLTMLKRLVSSRYIISLDDKNSNLLFDSSHEDQLMPNIQQIISELSISTKTFRPLLKNVTMRDAETAMSWMVWYINLQNSLFKKHLSNYRNKHLTILYIKSLDKSQIDVLFKIHTDDISGYTFYRMVVCRVGIDRFICLEH
jgi:hypothetical protein